MTTSAKSSLPRYLLIAAPIILAVAGLSYLAVLRYSHDDSWLMPKPYTEMMPEDSGEWMEKHFPGMDGKDVRTEVVYRNSDTGIRDWRADHTLAHETINFPDGSLRAKAEFAADGRQIIDGYFLRDDRSTLWTAQMDDTEMVTMTLYWVDGKTVFRRQQRQKGASRMEDWYYYQNGKNWKHYVGSIYRDANPSIEEVWNASGKLVFSHKVGLTDTSTDSVYRDDGSLDYKQYWGRGFGGFFGRGSIRSLLKTEVYQSDGVHLKQEILMAPGGYRIDRVIDYAADGSKTESTLDWDGTVEHIVQTDKAGKETKNEDVPKGPNRHKLVVEDKYRQSAVGKVDPTVEWSKQERAAQK